MLLGAFYLILTEKWSKETRGEEKEKRGWGKRRCYYGYKRFVRIIL